MFNINKKLKTELNRKISIYCILQIFFILCFFSSAFSAEYTRREDFAPVKLTILELNSILNDSFNFVSKGNKESQKTTDNILKTKATATFESQRSRSMVDLPISDDDLQKIPDRVTSFNFNLSSINGDISNLTLHLDDSSRFVEVSGKNLDQVTGLLKVMKEKIEIHEIIIGGSSWRTILGLVFNFIMIGFGMIWLFFRDKLNINVSDEDITSSTVLSIYAAIVIIIPAVVIFLIPWNNILPGCLISRDTLSFLDRNSSTFTFLGFIIALLLPVFQLIKKRKKQL
jgi:hypothetical protein